MTDGIVDTIILVWETNYCASKSGDFLQFLQFGKKEIVGQLKFREIFSKWGKDLIELLMCLRYGIFSPINVTGLFENALIV